MSCPQRVSQQVQLWEHNCLLHDGTCGTRTTCTTRTSITVSTGNCGISMVNENHGDQPLRRNREDDDLWNSHELHNRGIDHLVRVLGNLDGPTNSLDHGTSQSTTTGMMTTCGTRTTCTPGTSITLHTCNWESQWSDEQSGPCEKTSASRQGSTKSAKMSFWFIPAMMPSIMGLPIREETHREV